MIESSAAYQAAIVGDPRRILLRAIIDIIDPDITYGAVTSSGEIAWSRSEQLHDKDFSAPPAYVTLEHNRWLLGGQFHVFPDSAEGFDAPVGFIGDALSDSGAVLNEFVQLNFSNVSILQACSVWFSAQLWDGIPVDFTVEVLQGGTAYFTESVTDNDQTSVSFDGFTVQNPDAIRVTVTKWSKPSRRLRTVEIVPGVYEEWTGNMIAQYTLKHQGDVSCLTLPYGTCTIRMDNLDRRFEPRSKNGIFQSIEERQGIDVSLGCLLPDGTVEYKRVGIMYQYSGGWKTGNNGITMQWDLVDIVGLLSGREYVPPDTLPTTLEGWAASIVAQLGTNFADHYTVDPNYASLPLTVRTDSDVVGITCGDLLRYICMATGTWPRADAETGYLAVEPMWDAGGKITLENLVSYPTMKANGDIASIIFTLNDGNQTQYVVSGNSTASSTTQSISNPFLQTQAQALTAARMILSAYGGNRYEITGRGDPASEIGDVDTLWLDESQATTARRIQQDLSYQGGVLQNCASVLLQADGSYLFENRAVLTSSGSWTAPAGVTQLRLILVGHGENGTDGTDGSWSSEGMPGTDGSGGKVWAGTVNINPQQTFTVTIGEESVFGQYSSANGQVYPLGYTDIASGSNYGRSGVQSPLPGSGDGGAGGQAGKKGNRHTETIRGEDEEGNPFMETITVIDNYPTDGTPGISGASGCVVVYWDKEGT